MTHIPSMMQVLGEIEDARNAYSVAFEQIAQTSATDAPLTTDQLGRMFAAMQQHVHALEMALMSVVLGVTILADEAGLPGLGRGEGFDAD